MRRCVLIAMVMVLAGLMPMAARGQTPLGTSLTYQGELTSGGSPANGAFDLRFSLFDAAAGGNQIGETLCADDLAVAGGRFTVLLDFGAVFSGERRYLEIEVRQDSGLGCSDAGGYSVLTPRQELTSTANANFALNAATADSAVTAGDAATLGGRSASFFSNAANLMGTVPGSGLSGAYTNALTLSNPANIFSGNGAAITNLNAANISAGVLDAARMPINWPAGGDLSGFFPNPTIAPGAVTLSKLDAGVQSVLSSLSNVASTVAPIAPAAWGDNSLGQLNVPTLPGDPDFISVASGWDHSLAVRSDGTVVAWGSNSFSQLNVRALPPGVTYTAVAAGRLHSLALRNDGNIVGWGNGLAEQLQIPPLPPGLTYTAVAAGDVHSVAVRSDGNVLIWGALNDGAPALPAGVTYTNVAAGYFFCLALRSDGNIVAWGLNDRGQTNVPALPAGVTYTAMDAGAFHGLALRSDGTVVAWGSNGYGETTVLALPAGVTYTAVAAGESHSLALRSDGSLVAWGRNADGQTNVPALPADAIYTAIAGGRTHSVALRRGPRSGYLDATGGLRIGSSAPVPAEGGVSIAGDAYFGGRLVAAAFIGDGAGLTNVPAATLTGTIPQAALPFITQSALPASVWAVASLPNNVITSGGGVYTTVNGTSQGLPMRRGVAVVSWSTSAFTNSPNTAFHVRVKATSSGGFTTTGAPATYFFNQAGVHQTIAGNAVVPINSAGGTTFSLEVTRISGAGGYATDLNDGLTATIINLAE